MFALNQGEVCTCPSRALVQESIYDKFMERAVARVKKIKQGHPLDMTTMIGAQASNDQLEKILSYIDIGKQEGAKVLTGGKRAASRGRARGRLLRRADDLRRPQQDAHLPGGDLRAGGLGHDLQGRRGRARDRQRHAVRPRRRRVDAQRQHAPIASAAPSRPAASGPTAITPIRRTRRSAATSSRASAARRTR